MTTPRRRVLRPVRLDTGDGARERKLAARRVRLATEKQSLDRWMSRLKRAFHAVEKQQVKVARLERAIEQLAAKSTEGHPRRV
jgi:hypothetical protein